MARSATTPARMTFDGVARSRNAPPWLPARMNSMSGSSGASSRMTSAASRLGGCQLARNSARWAGRRVSRPVVANRSHHRLRRLPLGRGGHGDRGVGAVRDHRDVRGVPPVAGGEGRRVLDRAGGQRRRSADRSSLDLDHRVEQLPAQAGVGEHRSLEVGLHVVGVVDDRRVEPGLLDRRQKVGVGQDHDIGMGAGPAQRVDVVGGRADVAPGHDVGDRHGRRSAQLLADVVQRR